MVKEQKKCPVCGMAADENSEFKASIEGETYYFCSEEDNGESSRLILQNTCIGWSQLGLAGMKVSGPDVKELGKVLKQTENGLLTESLSEQKKLRRIG